MSNQSPRQLPPVDPHWPWGAIAFLNIEPGGTLKASWQPVQQAFRVEAGWELIVGYDGVDQDRFLIEVNENGESATCVPWGPELEKSLVEYVGRSRLDLGCTSDEPATGSARGLRALLDEARSLRLEDGSALRHERDQGLGFDASFEF